MPPELPHTATANTKDTKLSNKLSNNPSALMSLELFLRYAFSPRAHSVIKTLMRLSGASVCIAVGALVLCLSVVNGFNQSLQKKLLKREAHLVLQSSSKARADKALATAKALPHYSYARPFAEQDIIVLNHEGLFSGAIAKALPQEDLQKLYPNNGTDNDAGNGTSAKLTPKQVVLGSFLAQRLISFVGEELLIAPSENLLLPIGDGLNFNAVQVARVLEDSSEQPQGFVFYPMGSKHFNFRWGSTKMHGVELWLTNPHKAERLKTMWSKSLSMQGAEFSIKSWAERNRLLFYALRIEKILIALFLVLSVLITSFSVFGLKALLLTQKKQDIKILHALGVPQKQLGLIFANISFWLFALSAVAGIFWGAGVAFYLKWWPLDILPDIYYDTTLPSEPSSGIFLGVGSLCLLLAWILRRDHKSTSHT